MQEPATTQNGEHDARRRVASSSNAERAIHVGTLPVDPSAFAQIKAALDAEVLFPQLPWELDVVNDEIQILSARGSVLATIHDPLAAHIMANAAANWLMLLGCLPVLEKVAPRMGCEVLEQLQLSLGMKPVLGGASQCDANSAAEESGR